MKKCLLVSSVAVLISVCSVAQTTREQIEKAWKDPKAAENAAKADAMLIDKKKIMDSTRYEAIPPASKKEKAARSKRKKKPE